MKWWPHLYSLISSKTNDFNKNQFDVATLDEWIDGSRTHENLVISPWKNLYDALDSSIRTASLGEFKIRLELLKKFGEQSNYQNEWI